MYGLTSSRIWRLISNRNYKTVSSYSFSGRSFCGIPRKKIQSRFCTGWEPRQRKFFGLTGQWKGCEKAACLAVGKGSKQKEVYKMEESPKEMKAVLASSTFLAAFVLIQGQRLWYASSGSFKVAVFREKKLLLLPENGNGSHRKEKQRPVFLNHGDYVLLMSPGLYGQISQKVMVGCLNQKGSCEEKALRLVNFSRQDIKNKNLNSAVVVIRLR